MGEYRLSLEPVQFHRSCHRTDQGCRGRRCRCHPVGRAVLQQADPKWLVRPFPSDRSIDRTAGDPLRRSVAKACCLADETIARLAELPQIIGLKDATGDVTRPSRLRSLVGLEFRLLSGDDATALAFLAQGGDGCISVTSNVAPGLCRNMFFASRQGQ